MACTLKPTNILHLCDDIQEKIGKEIKCIRIQKDAKKRYDYTTKFISYYNAQSLKSSRVSRFLNSCIEHNIESKVYTSYEVLRKMSNLTAIDANIMKDLWKTFHTTNNEMIKYYFNYNTEQSNNMIAKIINNYDSDSDSESGDDEPDEDIEYPEYPHHVHDRWESSDSSDSEDSDDDYW